MRPRFTGPLNTNTRSWIRCHTITWFLGDSIREASHRMFKWIHYMDEKGYAIHTKSLSWTEGKEYEPGTLLMTYKPHDNFGSKP
jgi:hypothetical protein